MTRSRPVPASSPTLWPPVNETTRFNLHSPDVIHDFGVPGFLVKMDVIPGRVNSYQVTPTEIGEYLGKCYELCGVYHSRMLFKVKVVSHDSKPGVCRLFVKHDDLTEDLEDMAMVKVTEGRRTASSKEPPDAK